MEVTLMYLCLNGLSTWEILNNGAHSTIIVARTMTVCCCFRGTVFPALCVGLNNKF